MNKAFKLIFLLLMGFSDLVAQDIVTGNSNGPSVNGDDFRNGKIVGQVVDQDTDHPLDFATISVLTKLDSTVLTGGISELDGKFSASSPSRWRARPWSPASTSASVRATRREPRAGRRISSSTSSSRAPSHADPKPRSRRRSRASAGR